MSLIFSLFLIWICGLFNYSFIIITHAYTLENLPTHFTFYYETYKYDITNWDINNLNDSIYITSNFLINLIPSSIPSYINRSSLSHSPTSRTQYPPPKELVITLYNNTYVILTYETEDIWNEMYSNMYFRRRRLGWGGFWGYVPRRPGGLAKSRGYWRKAWTFEGRFMAHYPGRYKLFNYNGARKYCAEHYGGLAQIYHYKDNDDAFQLCRRIIPKYKPHGEWRTRVRCFWTCWTTTTWWTEPGRYAGYWKGKTCWIGLQYPFVNHKNARLIQKPIWEDDYHRIYKPIWDDYEPVRYTNWAPGEPNYQIVKHHKWVFNQNDHWVKQRWKTRTYHEKCTEIYAWYGYVSKGWPSTSEDHGWTHRKREGRIKEKWNNIGCHHKRAPICTVTPRKWLYEQYIAVRAARTYADARQFCLELYGTELATILNAGQAKQSMRACKRIDRKRPNCWIGLRAPWKKWDDGKWTKEFMNWSPGEPNNWAGDENCVELYSDADGKWNDVSCDAKRFFLCNMESSIARMDYDTREHLVSKRLERHRIKWDMYQKVAKRKRQAKEIFRRLKQKAKELREQQKKRMERMRDCMRQAMWDAKLGKRSNPDVCMAGGMGGSGGSGMMMGGMGGGMHAGMHARMGMGMGMNRGGMGMGGGMHPGMMNRGMHHQMQRGMNQGMMGRRFRRRRRRRRMREVLDTDSLYDDDNQKLSTRSRRFKLDKRLHDQYAHDTSGLGYFSSNSEESGLYETILDDQEINPWVPKKCVSLLNFGNIYEICIDNHYIQIKKYISTVKKHSHSNIYHDIKYNESHYMNYINNLDGSYQSYIEYENLKYYRNLKLNLDNAHGNNKTVEIYNDATQALGSFEFKYDINDNHNNQCWKFLNVYQICLEIDRDDIVLSINKEINIPSKIYYFLNDNEWDEINTIYNNNIDNDNYDNDINIEYEKCVHPFETKVCVKKYELKSSQQYAYKAFVSMQMESVV